MKRGGRHKHNASKIEENKDRLSDLPDCVLLHILSFLNAKDAVQTCMILSTRWKHLWKHLPTLTLNSWDFTSFKGFTKFVSRILSLRDASTTLDAFAFNRHRGLVKPRLLKRIAKYALSHNVQRLRISVFSEIEHIPPSIFSCQTLTSLHLSVQPNFYPGTKPLLVNSLNLPALISLHLEFVAFRGGDNARSEPFSSCHRLNSLSIVHCEVLDGQTLCISSTTLVNLTIRTGIYPWAGIKIDELCTPSLCTFDFRGIPVHKLCGSRSNLSSIKHAKIEVGMVSNSADTPSILLTWLLELANIKSLIVSSITLQVLSLFPDLLKVEFPSLCNLKSLKVKMNPVFHSLLSKILRDAKLEQAAARSQEEAFELREAFEAGLESSSIDSIPDGIMDFLLQNSPSAEVDII